MVWFNIYLEDWSTKSCWCLQDVRWKRRVQDDFLRNGVNRASFTAIGQTHQEELVWGNQRVHVCYLKFGWLLEIHILAYLCCPQVLFYLIPCFISLSLQNEYLITDGKVLVNPLMKRDPEGKLYWKILAEENYYKSIQLVLSFLVTKMKKAEAMSYKTHYLRRFSILAAEYNAGVCPSTW